MTNVDYELENKAFANGEYLAKIISDARSRYNIPAIAITVMNSEKILSQEIQGLRVFGQEEEATLDDYFHIGSCAKSVLALIATNYIEQESISWDTKFFDVYPELKAAASEVYYNITLQNLFLCRAGIQSFTNPKQDPFPEYGLDSAHNRLEFIKFLVAQPAASNIKKGVFRYLYSNASYTMAAAMLEKVATKSYEEIIRKTFSEDLNMPVHIGWPNSFNNNQPSGHIISGKNIETFSPEHSYKLPDLITAAGDLSLSPKNYADYTHMHLKGLRGDNNYISSAGYQNIHYCQKGFSFGVFNGRYGRKKYSGFDGSAGTFYCRSIMVPESDIAMSIMMNACPADMSTKIIDRLTLQVAKKKFGWWWMFWL